MRLSSLLSFALLGCQQTSQPVPPDQAAPSPNASAATAPETRSAAGSRTSIAIAELAALIGEYRVAGIDGEPLDAPIGIAVSIDPMTIELAPCAGLTWRYAFVAGTLQTDRIPLSPDELICRIPEEVAAAGTAFDAADRVHRTPTNGLEFSGGGHSVLLFSQ